jgi:citrate lyase subunit alpha/citrate CoA-transferase
MKARFARGGSNKYLVNMLNEGLVDYILDGQTFDSGGSEVDAREFSNHVNTSPFTSYNYHGKGNFASMLDVVILGATEVDVNFNANVVTHSDGVLLTRHWRLAELPVCKMYHSSRSAFSAIAFR